MKTLELPKKADPDFHDRSSAFCADIRVKFTHAVIVIRGKDCYPGIIDQVSVDPDTFELTLRCTLITREAPKTIAHPDKVFKLHLSRALALSCGQVKFEDINGDDIFLIPNKT